VQERVPRETEHSSSLFSGPEESPLECPMSDGDTAHSPGVFRGRTHKLD
jgi:hypothetical protein